MAELIRAGADVFRLNFSHGERDEHAANVAMAREASQVAGREVGLLGDLPGPKLRIDEVEGGVVELRAGVRADPDHRRGDRRRRSPAGLLGGAAGGGLRRATRSTSPTAGCGCVCSGRCPARIRCAVEVGGAVASHQGLNMPGTEVPAALRQPHRPGLGRLRGRAGHRPARGVLRPPRRGPGARRAPRPGGRRRHPADREDREAAGGRERRGDHPGGAERDHGRPRRPRHRDPDRAGADRPEAAPRAGRAPLPAVDHRDPDARLDGGVAADPPEPRSQTSPPRSTRERTR